MASKNKHVVYARGTIGTYAGFRAVFIRHYSGNMVELRVPGGVVCVDVSDFIVGLYET